jgi:II/X family phage/plasmid replication protein
MLIDWITARLPIESIPSNQWDMLRKLNDRVMRYCPRTGDVRWESCAWDSVRSDSHQIAIKVGSDAFWIQGSPGRVCGSGDAVFGDGVCSALDLQGCLLTMIRFVGTQTGVLLAPDCRQWIISRIDVTGNLLLGDLSEVRDALRILRGCEGGRYRVSQQAGDTVYWSHRSRLRSGKAYAKGPHITYMLRQRGYSGIEYAGSDQVLADRLLRLELRLGSQWLRERLGKTRVDLNEDESQWDQKIVDKSWLDLTADDLRKEWKEYFERMIGSGEMKQDSDVKEQVIVSAKTEGRGRAAYGCWLMIQAEGWERAREAYARSTWYDHLKVLRAAGLGDADISAGVVVPIRRRIIECQVVDTWEELRRAA